MFESLKSSIRSITRHDHDWRDIDEVDVYVVQRYKLEETNQFVATRVHVQECVECGEVLKVNEDLDTHDEMFRTYEDHDEYFTGGKERPTWVEGFYELKGKEYYQNRETFVRPELNIEDEIND